MIWLHHHSRSYLNWIVCVCVSGDDASDGVMVMIYGLMPLGLLYFLCVLMEADL